MGQQRQPKDEDKPEIEISWRTQELGSQMRRALFEKVFPSQASRNPASERPTAPPDKQKKQPKSEK